jgi:hypothetical protein
VFQRRVLLLFFSPFLSDVLSINFSHFRSAGATFDYNSTDNKQSIVQKMSALLAKLKQRLGSRMSIGYFSFSRKNKEQVKEWIIDQYDVLDITWEPNSQKKWDRQQINGNAILTMKIEDFCRMGHCYGAASHLKGHLPTINSAQDIVTLIEILMLVAALLMTFAINLHTGIFNHADLLEADQRFAKTWGKLDWTSTATCYHRDHGIFEPECEWLASARLQYHAVRAVFYFTFVLVVGLTVATTFLMSSFSEGTILQYHYFMTVFFILLCYALEIVGMYHLFLANDAAVRLSYPYYVLDEKASIRYDVFMNNSGAESDNGFPFILLDGWLFSYLLRYSIYATPVVIFGLHFWILTRS